MDGWMDGWMDRWAAGRQARWVGGKIGRDKQLGKKSYQTMGRLPYHSYAI